VRFSQTERDIAMDLLGRGVAPWAQVQRIALRREQEAAERCYAEFVAAKLQALK
jgi:hypothetical protein